MRAVFSLALVLLVFGKGTAATYHGPLSLGSFSIKQLTKVKALFEVLGPPATESAPFCYADVQRKTFLYIDVVPESPESAGVILLSDFENCPRRQVAISKADLLAWKTREGVGLKSSEVEVRKSYGSPMDATVTRPERLDKYIYGYRAIVLKPRSVDDSVLVYSGVMSDTVNDFRAAEFGSRKGKVRWILLSVDD